MNYVHSMLHVFLGKSTLVSKCARFLFVLRWDGALILLSRKYASHSSVLRLRPFLSLLVSDIFSLFTHLHLSSENSINLRLCRFQKPHVLYLYCVYGSGFGTTLCQVFWPIKRNSGTLCMLPILEFFVVPEEDSRY